MDSLLLAFLLLPFYASADACPIYTCNQNLPQDVCLSRREESGHIFIDLNICKESKVCDIYNILEDAKCKATYSYPLKYPGEYCHHNGECFSFRCDNYSKRCIGNPGGKECESDANCSNGLYCSDKNLCTQTKQDGQMCSEFEKCAAHLVCSKGTCTPMLSLENGERTDLPFACKSYFVLDGVCKEGPKLRREENDPESGPIPCNRGNCTYLLGESELVEPCQCGMTETEEQYCRPGIGDVDLADVNNV